VERTNHQASNCSIAAALKVVGEKWTLLIVRESFYGATRFEEFHRVLVCPRNLLTERLNMLVEEGIFERSEYKEPKRRPRMEYRLTSKGLELAMILLALMQWGDRHQAGPEGPPVLTRHAGCGGELRLTLECSEGHLPLGLSDAETVPGPGFLPAIPA
jgi:DNA-binding HxlR family transcriptional regulator